MVTAYILIQTEVGKASQVTDQIRELEGVMVVDPVTGPYDIVARGLTNVGEHVHPVDVLGLTDFGCARTELY